MVGAERITRTQISILCLPEVNADVVGESSRGCGARGLAGGRGRKSLPKEAWLDQEVAIDEVAVGVGDCSNTAFIKEWINAGFVNANIDDLIRLEAGAGKGDIRAWRIVWPVS